MKTFLLVWFLKSNFLLLTQFSFITMPAVTALFSCAVSGHPLVRSPLGGRRMFIQLPPWLTPHSRRLLLVVPSLRRRRLFLKASPSARVPFLPTEFSFSQPDPVGNGFFRRKLWWGEGPFSFSSCSLFWVPEAFGGVQFWPCSPPVPPCNTVTGGEHGQTNFYRAEWLSGGG